MTLRDLLLTVLRRWYVLVAALGIAALLVVTFGRGQVIYTTKTSLEFTYPTSSSLDRFNGTSDKSLISFVSAVVEKVTDGDPQFTYASLSAPLYGAGIRQRVVVSLPNDGNQFAAIYRRAQIDIDIVGPSSGWVRARQHEMINRINRTAESMQAGLDVSPENRIIPGVATRTLEIDRVAPSRSAVVYANIGLAVVALLAGGWGAVLLDRLDGLLDRRERRIRRADPLRARTSPDNESRGSMA